MELSAEIFGYEPGDGDALPASVEECYLELFPIAEERDAFSHMRVWLEAAHEDPTLDYREILGILNAGSRPVGMAYFTVYPLEGWAFVNYVGVLAPYRRGDVARRFVAAIQCFAVREHPEIVGALFEVENLDEARTRAALEAVATGLEVDEDVEVRLRRLALYAARNNIEIATIGAREPLVFRQPAMTAPLGPENEVTLNLMRQPWRPASSEDADSVAAAVRFVLHRLYGDVYVEGETSIPGFADYVVDLERRILAGREDQLHWAPLRLSAMERDLMRSVVRGDGFG